MKLNVEEIGKIGSSIAIQAWNCDNFYLTRDAVQYYHEKISDAVNEKGGDADDCAKAQTAFLEKIAKLGDKERIIKHFLQSVDLQLHKVVKASLLYLRANLDEYNDLFEDYDNPENKSPDCITEKQVNDAMRQLGIWDNVGQ